MDTSPVGDWWRPFKLVGAATVIHVDLKPDAAREAVALDWLDEPERSRWRRFQFAGPRRRFGLCRAALRAMLCRRHGCENGQLAFETARHGKPFATVDGMRVPDSFNVSHSGCHGLIAFAPAGRLGVDIEERVAHRNLDLLVETVLGEQEQALLARTRGDARTHLFFKLWTMKEALIKAHGKGMALDPSRLQIPSAMLGGTTRSTLQSPEIPGVRWRLDDLSNEQFAAAVVHEVCEAPGASRGNGGEMETPANL